MADDTTTDDLRRPYFETDQGDQTAHVLSTEYETPQDAHAAGVDPAYAAGVFRSAGMDDLAGQYDDYAKSVSQPAAAVAAPAAQPTIPAWDTVASHPDFQKLSPDAKQAVVDQYATHARDFALSLPNAPDSAALDDHFSQWRQTTKDRVVNPLTPDQAAAAQTDVGAGSGKAPLRPDGAPEPLYSVPAGEEFGGKPAGMIDYGNIDLNARPVVRNPDGSISTEKSFSFEQDGKEVLVPQVVNGKVVSPQEAKQHYFQTGENLGVFSSPDAADAYATQLHNRQNTYYNSTPSTAPTVAEQAQGIFGGGWEHLFTPALESTPVTTEPTDSKAASFGKALYNTISSFVSGFTSPAMAATIGAGAMPGLAKPVISAFLAQTVGQTPELAAKVKAAEQTPAWSQERWEAGLDVAVNSLFGAGLAHGLKSGHLTAETPTPEEVKDVASRFDVTKAPDEILQAAGADPVISREIPGVKYELDKRNLAPISSADLAKALGQRAADVKVAQDAATDMPETAKALTDKAQADYQSATKITPAQAHAEELATFHEQPEVQAAGEAEAKQPAISAAAEQPTTEEVTSGTTQSEEARSQAGQAGEGNNNPEAQTDLQRGIQPAGQGLSETAGEPSEPASPPGSTPVSGMSDAEVRKSVEDYLGKEGAPREPGDWSEIRADIESGMTRDQALRKYWNDKVALDERTAAEQAVRNRDFVANDERAKSAQMSPDQWKETSARKVYEAALSTRFKPTKGQRKPPSFEQWFDRTQANLSDHEMAINAATLHDAPVNAAAVEKYGIKLPEDYVKEGDQYAFKPETGNTPVSEKIVGATATIGDKTAVGVDHATAVENLAKQEGIDPEKIWSGEAGELDTKFITNTGRHVSLEEASQIAKKPNASHAAEIIPEKSSAEAAQPATQGDVGKTEGAETGSKQVADLKGHGEVDLLKAKEQIAKSLLDNAHLSDEVIKQGRDLAEVTRERKAAYQEAKTARKAAEQPTGARPVSLTPPEELPKANHAWRDAVTGEIYEGKPDETHVDILPRIPKDVRTSHRVATGELQNGFVTPGGDFITLNEWKNGSKGWFQDRSGAPKEYQDLYKSDTGSKPVPSEKSVSSVVKSPAEIAHTTATDLGKALQVPKGTTALRATTDKGKVSIVRAADLKGANVLQGAGPFKKIEAGTIGRGNEFLPMKEKIAVKPLGIAGEGGTESLKPRILPEDEENLGFEEKESGSPVKDLESQTEPEQASGLSRSSIADHQRATVKVVAEALQKIAPESSRAKNSATSATTDPELAGRIGARYGYVTKVAKELGVDVDTPLAGPETADKGSILDLLRNDLVRNARETGDPFKIKTAKGIVPYSAERSAWFNLQKYLDLHENAKRSEVPLQSTGAEDEGAPRSIEETTAAPEDRAQIESRFADFHNSLEKAIEDFSYDYPGASAKVTSEAARQVLDKIIGESTRYTKVDPKTGKAVEKNASLGFTKRGAPIKGASELAADPDFAAQVRERVFGKVASDARRKYQDSRDYMGLRALSVQPGDAMSLVEGANALKSKVASFVQAAKPKDTWTALFDAGDNKSRLVARELGNEVLHELQRVTDKKFEPHARRALSMMVEAQGDIGKLREAYAKIKNSPHAWAFDAKAAFEYAEDHFAELKPIADRYKAVMDGQIELENNNGIPTPRREGYVMHAQELGPSGLLFESGGGDISTGFTHERTHETFADSIAAGVKPKTLDAIDLLESRVSRGLRQINRKAWVEAGRDITDPSTQTALVADPITEQSGRVHAPKGYTLQNISGNQVAIHEGYAGLFDALTSTSKIRNSVVGRGALETAGSIKHGLLLFDTFHLGRLGFYNTVIRGKTTFNKGLLLLDNSAAELSKMHARGEIPADLPLDGILENKRILSGLVDSGYNLGGIQEAMFAGFVRTNRFLKGNVGAFNKWLFEKFQRGAMAESGIIEFNRQQKMFPERSDNDIARQVAKDLNTRFGNLRSQGWIKSRTGQDIAALSFLAEQWNEGLLRSEAGAYKQLAKGVGEAAVNRRFAVGALGRSVATMVIGQFIANQLINYATRGKPTWENQEEGLNAKISAWIPDFVGGGPGFFLNPMSMGAELQHQFLSRMEVNDNQVFKSLAQVAGYKFSPELRAALTAYQQKDQFGRSLTNDWQIAKQVGMALVPAPIPAKAGYRVGESFGKGSATQDFVGQIQRQAMATVGLKADQAPSPAQRVIRLARTYNRAHGVKENPEFSASDYSDLRRYLTLNDTDRAKQAYADLLKSKKDDVIQKYFRQQPLHPFTHNKTREGKFKASLSPEQRETYQKAVQEKKDISNRFFDLRKQVRSETHTGS